MKEGIDYHIKPIGKYLELSSMSFSGYTAGLEALNEQGYKINHRASTSIGTLMIAKTLPMTEIKAPVEEVVKKPATKKKVTPKNK